MSLFVISTRISFLSYPVANFYSLSLNDIFIIWNVIQFSYARGEFSDFSWTISILKNKFTRDIFYCLTLLNDIVFDYVFIVSCMNYRRET